MVGWIGKHLKKALVAWLKYYPSIRLRNVSLSQDSHCLDWDSKRGPPEQKSVHSIISNLEVPGSNLGLVTVVGTCKSCCPVHVGCRQTAKLLTKQQKMSRQNALIMRCRQRTCGQDCRGTVRVPRLVLTHLHYIWALAVTSLMAPTRIPCSGWAWTSINRWKK
jgi:hypothetical protein